MEPQKKWTLTSTKRKELNQLKLKICLKASPFLQEKHLSKMLPAPLWDNILSEAKSPANSCSICGSTDNQLYAYTDWSFHQGTSAVHLHRLHTLCYSCFCLRDYETSLHFLSKGQQEALINHFKEVNQCSDELYLLHIRDLKIQQHSDFPGLIEYAKKVGEGNVGHLSSLIHSLMDSHTGQTQPKSPLTFVVSKQFPCHKEVSNILNKQIDDLPKLPF